MTSELGGRVFVVDDDPLVRSSIEMTLSAAGFMTEKFASGTHFLACVTPSYVGCLLADVRMPGIDGLELQLELSRLNLPISTIIMTGHADVPLAVRAIKNGAIDILEKPFRRDRLLVQVASAISMAQMKLIQIQAAEADLTRLEMLTDREREVARFLAFGRTTKEIAKALGVSPRTIEIHRARVMQKLCVDSLPALVRVVRAIH